MKVAEKFDKWEKLWQDGKNEYLRRSHVSTEILRTILLKGQKGKTLYRIIDSDDRLFYEGIVNLRITCTTSDIDKLMYIANGVRRKSAAVVEFSKDTLSYEMQKTDSRWTDESEHLTFGKFKVSKKSNEIYINGCDIPLIHFYAEPIDQSVDFAKKLIQKRIGHYREDPSAKRLNDEAIIKMFNESTNYSMSNSKLPKYEENTMKIDWNKFFDRLTESEEPKGFAEEIAKVIDSTEAFTSKIDGNYIYIISKDGDGEMAEFELDEGVVHNYAPRTLNPSSAGNGKNIFKICDPSLSYWSDSGREFLYIYENEEKCLLKLKNRFKDLVRYLTLKTLYENDDKELNGWHCAQWGTWKFRISSIDDVKKYLATLEDAYDEANGMLPPMYVEESIDLTTVYDNILKEGSWTHSSGYVPHDGNGMVGGKWSSANTSGEYEKEIEVELDDTYYLVYLTMNADLDQGYDDSVNYSWSNVNIDENSIQLKDMMRELSDEQDVIDPELRNKLFKLAKEKLLANPDKYFENDFEIDEPDYPDYEPDDF